MISFSSIIRMIRAFHRMTPCGCTLDQLRLHIESQFRAGMTWENYGHVWVLDHITPQGFFISDYESAHHFTNIQPLFIRENQKKASWMGGMHFKDTPQYKVIRDKHHEELRLQRESWDIMHEPLRIQTTSVFATGEWADFDLDNY